MLSPDIPLSLLAVAAVFPPLFYLWSMVSLERRVEPPAVVIGLFVIGAIGAVLFNHLVTPFVSSDVFWTGNPLLTAAGQVLLLIALPGETLRWVVFFIFCQHFIHRDHPMAGAVFGAAMGLGYAAVENVGYMLLHLDHWQDVAFVRAVVTVPVHGALGAVSGIYFARARFRAVAGYRMAWGGYVRALLVPMILHALYDFPFAFSRQLDFAGNTPILLLRGGGLAVGLAVFLVGAALTYRQVLQEDAAFRPICLTPYLLRPPWHLFVLGSLLGMLGLLIAGVEVAALLRGAELSGPRLAMLGASLMLLISTACLHLMGRRMRARRMVG